MNVHFSGLYLRLDWDGYLTLKEAREWYKKGNGLPLYVDLEKIDLSGILSLGEKYVGQEKVVNLFFCSNSLNDAMVLEQIKENYIQTIRKAKFTPSQKTKCSECYFTLPYRIGSKIDY